MPAFGSSFGSPLLTKADNETATLKRSSVYPPDPRARLVGEPREELEVHHFKSPIDDALSIETIHAGRRVRWVDRIGFHAVLKWTGAERQSARWLRVNLS